MTHAYSYFKQKHAHPRSLNISYTVRPNVGQWVIDIRINGCLWSGATLSAVDITIISTRCGPLIINLLSAMFAEQGVVHMHINHYHYGLGGFIESAENTTQYAWCTFHIGASFNARRNTCFLELILQNSYIRYFRKLYKHRNYTVRFNIRIW